MISSLGELKLNRTTPGRKRNRRACLLSVGHAIPRGSNADQRNCHKTPRHKTWFVLSFVSPFRDALWTDITTLEWTLRCKCYNERTKKLGENTGNTKCSREKHFRRGLLHKTKRNSTNESHLVGESSSEYHTSRLSHESTTNVIFLLYPYLSTNTHVAWVCPSFLWLGRTTPSLCVLRVLLISFFFVFLLTPPAASRVLEMGRNLTWFSWSSSGIKTTRK